MKEFFMVIIAYIVSSLLYMRIYQKANLQDAWLAWIPIGNLIPFFRLIKRSIWNILWLLIPVVNIVFLVFFYAKFFKAFGMSPGFVVVVLLPVIGGFFAPLYSILGSFVLLILLAYMVYADNVQYQWN